MTLLAKYVRRLKGRAAWIIGGKRIGRIVARALAEQGVHLIINYLHSKKEADDTAAMARRLGVRALAVRADAADRAGVAAAIHGFSRQFPRLDLLINMASVFDEVEMPRITPADWKRNIDAHILGSFWPAQLALPLMRRGAHMSAPGKADVNPPVQYGTDQDRATHSDRNSAFRKVTN